MYIVYFYIGESLPEHLFDSIYQTCQIHDKLQRSDYKLILITNKKWESYILDKIKLYNITPKLNIIYSEELESIYTFNKYKQIAKTFSQQQTQFRNGFWIYTTTRFLYISAFMEKYNINNVFHLESDVMIYENLSITQDKLKSLKMSDKIVAVQDAEHRAVCSIVYLPTIKSACDYSDYIINSLEHCTKHQTFLNDMDLMGRYKNKYNFPDSPYDTQGKVSNSESLIRVETLGVYDANGIGQYLGGIDFKNIDPKLIINSYINPTIGFINETATFKPNTASYRKATINNKIYNGKKYFIGDSTKFYDLNAIHVHSKQLYLFSSVFDICYADIITGDRIIQFCDFIITDRNQYNYNTNLMKYNQNVLLVNDFQNVNIQKINKYIEDKQTKQIRLFVFIDNMENFMKYILPHLNNKYEYILYSHNGDYPFDNKYIEIINDPKIKMVYAQNINVQSSKVKMLPIGLARDMFQHGDINTMYEKMVTTYKNKKTKNIYININESTHPLRKEVMNNIRKNSSKWEIQPGNVSFAKYLEDLSQYKFCLCIRGNGIDTHRFWESLYMGVIPVIYEDDESIITIKELNRMKVPFYTIKRKNELEMSSEYFNETLRQKILDDKIAQHIQCGDYLKLSNYKRN